MHADELTKGIVRSNPVFVLVLGLCPALATSARMDTALAMGLAATFVLVCSNTVVAVIRRGVPQGVRIPCYIVVIATFVTIADLVLQAKWPAVSDEIGIFVPLIVVNCIILGRAEAFASKHGVGDSLLDGVGMGLGFTLALLVLSAVRELVGRGEVWGVPVVRAAGQWAGIGPLARFQPVTVIGLAPGAFLVLGLLMGLFRWVGELRKAR